MSWWMLPVVLSVLGALKCAWRWLTRSQAPACAVAAQVFQQQEQEAASVDRFAR